MGRAAPSEFIAMAEEVGLIVDLGMYVLERTARELSGWQRAVRRRDSVFATVNISSRQLLRQDLIHDLRTVIARAGLARGTLKLELTEALVMENPEHTAQMLQRIRDLGAGLALDDFGSGHSSLAYLQRFPFDTIKIDQSFVRTNGKGARPVVLRSIISLAHDLGMEVVAERAETDSDAVELSQLGCEYAQGHHFGKPMSADDAKALLQDDDVREESEFAKDHLPGAVHLGKGVIERDIEQKVPDTGTKLVLYCGGGFRSALAADALQKMGTKDKNYYRDGFHARTRAEEHKCEAMELNVLISIEDVTARVNAAVKPDAPAEEAFKARRAIMAEIEKESTDKTGLRSDVITLYQGGLYHLYRLKKYTDVRVVFAPLDQAQIAR